MLSLIKVRNYAIIDEVELELDRGFSVMTGETGAGKSILVDALGLALGDRADASTVRSGAERAEISVQFDCPDGHAAIDWLRERGLDDGAQCTLRRVIGADGRSRSFINGQPATLQDLKLLGGLLVDIHGQHEHQSLLDAGAQRALLDAHGALEERARGVAEAYAAWREVERELEGRRDASADREAQLELLRFQVGELESLAPANGEPESLRTERDRLANVDRLLGGVGAALDSCSKTRPVRPTPPWFTRGASSSVSQSTIPSCRLRPSVLPASRSSFARSARRSIAIASASKRIPRGSSGSTSGSRNSARSLGVTPVEERELCAVLDTLRRRLADLDGGAESIEDLAARATSARGAYFKRATQLSAARKKSATTLGRAVTEQLVELGMPNGEFRIELAEKPEERADATGLERVSFEVRLNPGQPFGPLERVASGGELSRISLAIEVVLSGASPVPTFVFDEVDAGVGGRVAEIVGRKLSQLGDSRQVVCVTHLPQVASQGQRHYRVIKLTDGKLSRTNVRALGSEERVEELSRMLGGIEITERTRAHAEEMIERAKR
jgi:DNA repair protein RecN (Recombination protein N)